MHGIQILVSQHGTTQQLTMAAFGEPDGVHSLDCVWKISHKCFELWKRLTYILLTTFYGICIAAEWGYEFAYISCKSSYHTITITTSPNTVYIRHCIYLISKKRCKVEMHVFQSRLQRIQQQI
jgi:hypothetical protein